MTRLPSLSLFSPVLAEEAGGLQRADVFEVLSNERRRRLLQQLDAEDDRVAVSDLADSLAAAEAARRDGDPEESINRIRSSVYSALVQTHLPMMADAGIVEYDDQLQEVRVTDRTREVQLYLEYSPRNDIPWAEYYLGLAAVAAALVVVSWLGVPPFGHLTGFMVSGFVITLLVASSLIHVLEMRRNQIETGQN